MKMKAPGVIAENRKEVVWLDVIMRSVPLNGFIYHAYQENHGYITRRGIGNESRDPMAIRHFHRNSPRCVAYFLMFWRDVSATSLMSFAISLSKH